MSTILLRELIVLGRRGSFAAAACGVLAMAALFTVAWPTGLALGPGTGLLRQLELLLQFSAAAIVTWMTCRCGSRERADDLVRLAALSAVPPSRVLGARFLAHAAAVALLACAVLPFLVYAREVTAVAVASVAAVAARFIAAGSIAVAAALAFEHLIATYHWRWLTAAATTGLVVGLSILVAATPAIVIAVAAAMVTAFATIAARADRTCRYLSDGDA